MTATQTLPAVAANRGRGPYVIPRAVPVLLAALVVLAGAREMVGLWQEIADHLARTGAELGVRCLVGVFERAGEAGGPGPQLSALAALELTRDAAGAIRTGLLALPLMYSATGLAVAAGRVAWVRSHRSAALAFATP